MSKLEIALEAFENLKKHEVDSVLMVLLEQEKVDIPRLIAVYAQFLQQFRHNAMNDIRTLSEAGVELAQKEIRKISSIKSEQKRQLYTALANTLLAEGRRATKFNDELGKFVDMSIVDKSWYEGTWQLRTVQCQKEK